MAQELIKNVPRSERFVMKDLVTVQPGQVVSRTLAQNRSMSLTVFAFDQGEEIAAHTTPGDALVQVLEGKGLISIGDTDHELAQGEAILMPREVPHALKALESFKMVLTVVFEA